MTDNALVAECHAFSLHLSDNAPTPYVLSCYERLLPTAVVPDAVAALPIERALLAAGRAGGLRLRIADGYTRFFRPRSELRRRLLLLFAILENSPHSSPYLNSGDEGSLVAVGGRMIITGTASVVCVLIGVVLLGPVHLVSAAMPSARAAEERRP